jgi:hypothetical protein
LAVGSIIAGSDGARLIPALELHTACVVASELVDHLILLRDRTASFQDLGRLSTGT